MSYKDDNDWDFGDADDGFTFSNNETNVTTLSNNDVGEFHFATGDSVVPTAWSIPEGGGGMPVAATSSVSLYDVTAASFGEDDFGFGDDNEWRAEGKESAPAHVEGLKLGIHPSKTEPMSAAQSNKARPVGVQVGVGGGIDPSPPAGTADSSSVASNNRSLYMVDEHIDNDEKRSKAPLSSSNNSNSGSHIFVVQHDNFDDEEGGDGDMFTFHSEPYALLSDNTDDTAADESLGRISSSNNAKKGGDGDANSLFGGGESNNSTSEQYTDMMKVSSLPAEEKAISSGNGSHMVVVVEENDTADYCDGDLDDLPTTFAVNETPYARSDENDIVTQKSQQKPLRRVVFDLAPAPEQSRSPRTLRAEATAASGSNAHTHDDRYGDQNDSTKSEAFARALRQPPPLPPPVSHITRNSEVPAAPHPQAPPRPQQLSGTNTNTNTNILGEEEQKEAQHSHLDPNDDDSFFDFPEEYVPANSSNHIGASSSSINLNPAVVVSPSPSSYYASMYDDQHTYNYDDDSDDGVNEGRVIQRFNELRKWRMLLTHNEDLLREVHEKKMKLINRKRRYVALADKLSMELLFTVAKTPDQQQQSILLSTDTKSVVLKLFSAEVEGYSSKSSGVRQGSNNNSNSKNASRGGEEEEEGEEETRDRFDDNESHHSEGEAEGEGLTEGDNTTNNKTNGRGGVNNNNTNNNNVDDDFDEDLPLLSLIGQKRNRVGGSATGEDGDNSTKFKKSKSKASVPQDSQSRTASTSKSTASSLSSSKKRAMARASKDDRYNELVHEENVVAIKTNYIRDPFTWYNREPPISSEGRDVLCLERMFPKPCYTSRRRFVQWTPQAESMLRALVGCLGLDNGDGDGVGGVGVRRQPDLLVSSGRTVTDAQAIQSTSPPSGPSSSVRSATHSSGTSGGGGAATAISSHANSPSLVATTLTATKGGTAITDPLPPPASAHEIKQQQPISSSNGGQQSFDDLRDALFQQLPGSRNDFAILRQQPRDLRWTYARDLLERVGTAEGGLGTYVKPEPGEESVGFRNYVPLSPLEVECHYFNAVKTPKLKVDDFTQEEDLVLFDCMTVLNRAAGKAIFVGYTHPHTDREGRAVGRTHARVNPWLEVSARLPGRSVFACIQRFQLYINETFLAKRFIVGSEAHQVLSRVINIIGTANHLVVTQVTNAVLDKLYENEIGLRRRKTVLGMRQRECDRSRSILNPQQSGGTPALTASCRYSHSAASSRSPQLQAHFYGNSRSPQQANNNFAALHGVGGHVNTLSPYIKPVGVRGNTGAAADVPSHSQSHSPHTDEEERDGAKADASVHENEPSNTHTHRHHRNGRDGGIHLETTQGSLSEGQTLTDEVMLKIFGSSDSTSRSPAARGHHNNIPHMPLPPAVSHSTSSQGPHHENQQSNTNNTLMNNSSSSSSGSPTPHELPHHLRDGAIPYNCAFRTTGYVSSESVRIFLTKLRTELKIGRGGGVAGAGVNGHLPAEAEDDEDEHLSTGGILRTLSKAVTEETLWLAIFVTSAVCLLRGPITTVFLRNFASQSYDMATCMLQRKKHAVVGNSNVGHFELVPSPELLLSECEKISIASEITAHTCTTVMKRPCLVPKLFTQLCISVAAQQKNLEKWVKLPEFVEGKPKRKIRRKEDIDGDESTAAASRATGRKAIGSSMRSSRRTPTQGVASSEGRVSSRVVSASIGKAPMYPAGRVMIGFARPKVAPQPTPAAYGQGEAAAATTTMAIPLNSHSNPNNMGLRGGSTGGSMVQNPISSTGDLLVALNSHRHQPTSASVDPHPLLPTSPPLNPVTTNPPSLITSPTSYTNNMSDFPLAYP